MKNDQLASNLRMMSSRMYKRLNKEMRASASLSLTEVISLSHLYNNKTHTPSELAALLNVKSQSMSEVLIRLMDFGLIQKKQATDDKRKTEVSLTAEGIALVEQTRLERDEWLSNAIETRLSVAERELLASAVLLIEKLIDSK